MTTATRLQIVVEGKFDAYVICELLKSHGLAVLLQDRRDKSRSEIVVEPPIADDPGANGREQLLVDIANRVKVANVATAVVLDADSQAFQQRGPHVTWIAIRDRLKPFDPMIDSHKSAPPEGYTGRYEALGINLGVWLMPDNLSEGMIEDFLRGMIVKDDLLIDYAIECTDEAKASYSAPFDDKDRSKAVLATWLAWQKDTPSRIGVALRRQSLDKDSSLAATFIAWVRRLLVPTEPTVKQPRPRC